MRQNKGHAALGILDFYVASFFSGRPYAFFFPFFSDSTLARGKLNQHRKTLCVSPLIRAEEVFASPLAPPPPHQSLCFFDGSPLRFFAWL